MSPLAPSWDCDSWSPMSSPAELQPYVEELMENPDGGFVAEFEAELLTYWSGSCTTVDCTDYSTHNPEYCSQVSCVTDAGDSFYRETRSYDDHSGSYSSGDGEVTWTVVLATGEELHLVQSESSSSTRDSWSWGGSSEGSWVGQPIPDLPADGSFYAGSGVSERTGTWVATSGNWVTPGCMLSGSYGGYDGEMIQEYEVRIGPTSVHAENWSDCGGVIPGEGWAWLDGGGARFVDWETWEEIPGDADGDLAWDERLDCDPTNPDINRCADEIPGDGIDQNCNGVDQADLDGDGYYGAPDGPDCDDGDPAIHPGADDEPDDGIDQDCDGVDEDPHDSGDSGDSGDTASSGAMARPEEQDEDETEEGKGGLACAAPSAPRGSGAPAGPALLGGLAAMLAWRRRPPAGSARSRR